MENLSILMAESTLHPIHEWGIKVIENFQSFQNPVLTIITKLITFLGDPMFYLILLPVLFWCIDEKKAFKISLVVFVSNGINLSIKNKLKIARPYTHKSSIKLITETGFSTPSGHSQTSAVLWPSIAFSWKKIFLLVLAIIFPILIGLSRIYLGVHYPTDVFLGWGIGAIIIFFAYPIGKLAVKLWQKAIEGPFSLIYESFLEHKKNKPNSAATWQLILVAILSLILNLLSPCDSSMGGLVFGFAAGYIYLKTSRETFSAAQGSLIKKLLRILIGFSGLVVIYFGLKIFFTKLDCTQQNLLRFLRYGLTGFWATFIAPKIFIKLKI